MVGKRGGGGLQREFKLFLYILCLMAGCWCCVCTRLVFNNSLCDMMLIIMHLNDDVPQNGGRSLEDAGGRGEADGGVSTSLPLPSW